jgi:phosphopantothenoylcysteine decarboxylase
MQDNNKRILLGCSGSVAVVKIPELYHELCKIGQVKIIMTIAALKFLDEEFLLTKRDCIYLDPDENFSKIGDPILHIELSKWANVLILAPLSANTLAKISNGICDNLLTNIVRAWNWNKVTIITPSMNTQMWNNVITAKQLDIIKSFGTGITLIEPVCKVLACGDYGVGAMGSVEDIVKVVSLLD